MFYVMKHYTDEFGIMHAVAARITPYKTEKKATNKMNKIGKGAFLINRHHKVIAVYGVIH